MQRGSTNRWRAPALPGLQRIWHARGLKPHLVDTFKISTDPAFEEKLTDVVGLYSNPNSALLVRGLNPFLAAKTHHCDSPRSRRMRLNRAHDVLTVAISATAVTRVRY